MHKLKRLLYSNKFYRFIFGTKGYLKEGCLYTSSDNLFQRIGRFLATNPYTPLIPLIPLIFTLVTFGILYFCPSFNFRFIPIKVNESGVISNIFLNLLASFLVIVSYEFTRSKQEELIN